MPVVLWRDGKEVTVQATLAEQPDDVQVAAATTGDKGQAQKPTDISGLGLKLAPISAGDEGQVPARRGSEGRGDHRRRAEQFRGRARPEGGRCDRRGAAGRGDVARRVQKQVDTVRKENRKSVLMLIQRQDGVQWVPLSISGPDKDKQPG